MAFQLSISDGTTTINLANATGFQSSEPYLIMPSIPTGDGSIPEYVTETIPVYINISTDDNLASTMQDFHALQLRAAEYWQDPDANTPVWFTRQLAAETSATRTLVRSLAYEPTQDLEGSFIADVPCIASGRSGELIVTHHPYNEASSATTASGATIDYLGGTKTINSVPGDVAARISLLSFTGTQGMNWDEGVYIGIRSNGKNGATLANVVSLWECEDGTNGPDSSDQADATASGGNYVQVNWAVAGNDWYDRLSMPMSTYCGANEDDNYGTYLILLRAKCSAGSTVINVRAILRSGGAGATDGMDVTNDAVEITSTSWHLYNLGTVTWPLVGRRYSLATYDAGDDRIVLNCKTDGGGANLMLDCVIMLPIDEAWFVVPPSLIGTSIAATDDYEFGVLPNDDYTPLLHLESTGELAYAIVPSVSPSFGLRPGSNLLVYATECAVATGDVTLAVSYVPRWVSLRGAE